MQNEIDQLVNVEIDIQSPVTFGDTFDIILVIGAAPTVPADTPDVGIYAGMQDITAGGWKKGEVIYEALSVAFSQMNAPKSIVVAVKKENDAITDVLDRAAGITNFYGIFLTDATPEENKEAAAWATVNEKLIAFSTESEESAETSIRAIPIYHKGTENFAALAWMVNCFNYAPGTETWAYKTLYGIKADELSTSLKTKLQNNNINFYMHVGGKNITFPGKTCGGEWIDVIRFRDYLISEIRQKVFNLFVIHPKIPYLDNGILLIENNIREVLSLGQGAGGIAEDEITDDGILPGYTITVPVARNISAEDRAARRLTGISFQARLSGAIHLANIKGSIII